MAPYLGQTVIFVPRPGAARAGRAELAAIVTRLHGDDCVSLYALCDDPHGDVWHQDKVPPQTQERLTNCWRPVDDGMAALRAEIAELRAIVEGAVSRRAKG